MFGRTFYSLGLLPGRRLEWRTAVTAWPQHWPCAKGPDYEVICWGACLKGAGLNRNTLAWRGPQRSCAEAASGTLNRNLCPGTESDPWAVKHYDCSQSITDLSGCCRGHSHRTCCLFRMCPAMLCFWESCNPNTLSSFEHCKKYLKDCSLIVIRYQCTVPTHTFLDNDCICTQVL